jgi:hypothetical protein
MAVTRAGRDDRSEPAPATLAGPALRDALLRGGYILYFRHTSTDFGQNDDAMTSFDDCTKQRNLTEQGRAEARAIGAAVARLRIPVGDVLASPYCRTLETGRLMFGRATATPAVRGGPAAAEPPLRGAARPARYTGGRRGRPRDRQPRQSVSRRD